MTKARPGNDRSRPLARTRDSGGSRAPVPARAGVKKAVVDAPRVPRQRRAFSTVGGPVDSSGDPVEAAALERLWAVDAGLARALTHGFHAYAGRMHPSIARSAIERWT